LFTPLIGIYAPAADSRSLMQELRQRLLEETDYRLEAENQRQFAEIFRDDPVIRVPAVIDELSSARVLTMEMATGMPFKVFKERGSQEARDQAALALVRFVGAAFSRHRIYNGDPHPGNYLFGEDGTISFLDFGCVQRFSDSF